MGIDTQLRSEDGRVLTEVGDPNSVLSRAVTRHSLSGTRLLRYLVPWGDTVFNQAQAPDLLHDLREIIEQHAGKPLAELLAQVTPLAEQLSAETHVYLWLVGD